MSAKMKIKKRDSIRIGPKKWLPKPQLARVDPRIPLNGRKMSFDLHGVVDDMDDFFRQLMADLIAAGWEIHILTGITQEEGLKKLKKLRIPFTHYFSIIDYHTSIGTPIRWADKNHPYMDNYTWSETKGLYCYANGISMHFDDSDIYGFFFKTPYARVFTKGSDRVKKIRLAE